MRFSIRTAREVFRGRVFRLVNETAVLPNGRTTTLNIVHHPGAVAIVPVFDDGDVLLIRQFRPAVRGWLHEIPAGTLEPGEPPAATARREVVEETGYRARTMNKIAEFYTSPGFCTERLRLFVATGLTPAHAEKDDDEIIEPLRVPLKRALEMGRNGRIRDAKSLLGLLMASEWLAARRRRGRS